MERSLRGNVKREEGGDVSWFVVQGDAGVMCVCVWEGIVLSQREVLFCLERTQEREEERV